MLNFFLCILLIKFLLFSSAQGIWEERKGKCTSYFPCGSSEILWKCFTVDRKRKYEKNWSCLETTDLLNSEGVQNFLNKEEKLVHGAFHHGNQNVLKVTFWANGFYSSYFIFWHWKKKITFERAFSRGYAFASFPWLFCNQLCRKLFLL